MPLNLMGPTILRNVHDFKATHGMSSIPIKKKWKCMARGCVKGYRSFDKVCGKQKKFKEFHMEVSDHVDELSLGKKVKLEDEDRVGASSSIDSFTEYSGLASQLGSATTIGQAKRTE